MRFVACVGSENAQVLLPNFQNVRGGGGGGGGEGGSR